MTTDLAHLETQICIVTPDTPAGDIAATLYKVEFLIRRAKELKDALTQKMIEKIEITGQPIVIGPVCYTVADPPDTKCLDNKGTLEATFEANDGDFGKVADCMSSKAWKHGACKAVLPGETYGKLFKTERRKKLVAGEAVKQLQATNMEFVK